MLLLDKLVIQEIAYQTYVHGVVAVLMRKEKSHFPSYPIFVGPYQIENVNQAREEENILSSFHFGEGIYIRHYPHRVVASYFSKYFVSWLYSHEYFLEEEYHVGAISLK